MKTLLPLVLAILLAGTARAGAQGYSGGGGCGQGALDGNCNLIVPPLVSLMLSPDGTRVIGTTSAGTIDPGPPALLGDVTGTTASTAAPRWRPAWTTVTVTAGATVQVPSGYPIVDLSGSGLIAAATVKLPASPTDRDTVRLVAMGALSITLLSVQDANGVSVQGAFGLGQASTALYQYQGTNWVRIGA